MKKILSFLVLLLSVAHLHSFQKTKGAVLLGLSAYYYMQLPLLFSWLKEPGRQYSVYQTLQENNDSTAQWIVKITNNDGNIYHINVPLIKATPPGLLKVYSQKLLRLIINDFYAHGTSLSNVPGFTAHTFMLNNQCILQLRIDDKRVVAHCVTQNCYVISGSAGISCKKSSIQWLSYTTHASALGAYNICRLGCILVGSYGCIKTLGIF